MNPGKGNVQPIIKPAAVPAFEKGLPANIDAERFILGSILLDGSRLLEVADVIRPDDFALEKHRRIFQRAMEVHERGETIDRVNVANELLRWNELESVDGLNYLASLDDGMPHIANIESYLRILREKAILRRLAHVGQSLLNRALVAEEDPGAILASVSDQMERIGVGADTRKSGAIECLPAVSAVAENVRFLRDPELPEAALVALTGDAGSGKSTVCTAWARDAIAIGRPVLLMDRENPRSVALDRMQRLGLEDGPLLRWFGGWCGDVPGPDSAAVIRWVRSCDPKPLVVVDSLIAFLNGDENDAGEMRRFTHQLRRLADLGATVVLIHHNGKADSARDFRGSSDFKSAVDVAFAVSNIGPTMRLDTLRLRCFKSRYGFDGEIVYRYADGRFLRDDRPTAPARTLTDQLRQILRSNPNVKAKEFEDLAMKSEIGRDRARQFLDDGCDEGTIRRTTGERNAKFYLWVGGEIE